MKRSPSSKKKTAAKSESPKRQKRSKSPSLPALEVVRITPNNLVTYHTIDLQAKISSLDDLKRLLSESLTRLSKQYQLFINGKVILHILPSENFQQVTVVEERPLKRKKVFQRISTLQKIIGSGFFESDLSKPMETGLDVIELENQGFLDAEFIEEYPDVMEDLIGFLFKRR